MNRWVVAAAVLLATAATAGAASKPAGNGLIVFASDRAPDRLGEIYAVNSKGSKPRDLSRSSEADSLPVVSPSGSRIAFFSRRTGYWALYVKRVDGTGLRRVTDRLDVVSDYGLHIAWAPREDAIAFDTAGAVHEQVYVANTRARRVRLLAEDALDPSWSADGKRIAYTGFTGTFDIVVVDRDGRRLWARQSATDPHWSPRGSKLEFRTGLFEVVVTDASGHTLASFSDPSGAPTFFRSWSPDGRWIALHSYAATGSAYPELVLGEVDSGMIRRVGTGAFGASLDDASWSPDSKRIAFSRAGPSPLTYTISVAQVQSGHITPIADTGPVLGWSPDGSRIAFSDVASSLSCGSIFTVRPNGRSRRRVVRPPPGSALSWAGWAQHGRTLVYESRFGGALFTIQPDGRGLKRLTKDGGCGDSTPAWSPDGRKIAFARQRQLIRANSLYILPLDGAASELVAGLAPGGYRLGDPSWSPDGLRIAYSVLGHVSSEIYVVPIGGGESAPIESGTHPSWAPDGERLAHTEPFDTGLFVTGSGRVAADALPDTGTAWSPDGQWIAYVASDGIRAVHPDGTGGTLIVPSSDSARPRSPAWSPDGEWLAFFQEGDLWIVRKDGTEQRRLTSGPATDSSPSWQTLPG